MSAYSLLNVRVGLASGEVGSVGERSRDREDVGAVGEGGGIVTELAHSLEDELEPVLKLILVGWNKENVSIRTFDALMRRLLPKDCHSQAVRESRAS